MNAPTLPNDYTAYPDAAGRFGRFGGRYMPETLMPLVHDLDAAYSAAKADEGFQAELAGLLELHLALSHHGPDLAQDLAVPPRARWTGSWTLAAAAVLLVALVPAAYTVQRTQNLRAQARDTARLEQLARRIVRDGLCPGQGRCTG